MDSPCKRYYNLVKIASIRASEVVAGSSPLRRVGIGVEVEDFRKYAEGDDARHIDWRITARKPSENGEYELFVREYRAERSLKPVLVVDITASMGFWNKYLTSLYLSSLILHILSFFNDILSIILIMDNIRIYRSMDATTLSSLLAREVCHNGPKGSLSLVDCLRYIHHKKPLFMITDYAHSIGEIKEVLQFVMALEIPTLFLFTTAPEEKIDYGLASIAVLDPERGTLRWGRGSDLSHKINIHIKTIKSIVSSYGGYVEIEGLDDARAKSNKIYFSILKAREMCY